MKNVQKISVAMICGGPSAERGISLNSARSVLDHLSSESVEIVPFYLDIQKNAYRISTAQLYSNTPSDFDFKLAQAAKPLTEEQFVRALTRCHLVFPVMHGPYGEDGGIQAFLERHGIPFVGSGSAACKKAFDKHSGNEYIRAHGFFTLPSALLKIYQRDHRAIIARFFKEHSIRRAVVKPATGGSSIGVYSVSTPEEALERAERLFSKRADTRVVVEPFAEGKEFTVIILQNRFGLPVALPPTEIETDYSAHQIFDFRKKYLPTRHVSYHSPPRFQDADIERIQAQAEQLFALFGMRDFARFDGWILQSGEVWFCDFNTVSGMEQNSFLFQQAARVGLTHSGVLRYILASAARRHGLRLPDESAVRERNERKPASARPEPASARRRPVAVLFGGPTSERQVSLMSGTNVWLKLRNSKMYEPHPYLLDADGKTIWKVPYHLALNHTVEEIAENCADYAMAKTRLAEYETRARLHLDLKDKKDVREFFDPEKLSLDTLTAQYEFIFNALHGGAGEDGTLQAMFEKKRVKSNGPNANVSRLCIDKWATAERVRALRLEGVSATAGAVLDTKELLAYDETRLRALWTRLRKDLRAKTLILKPRGDGCSTGVAHLYAPDDLSAYLELIRRRAAHAPAGTFAHQSTVIEMPPERPESLIFEQFIETDGLRVVKNELKHRRKTGLVEITVGVLERSGTLEALNPSITIAEGEVLSVEEKFQGGTGVNLTPPPPAVISPSVVRTIKTRIALLANKLGIEGYSRIDAFVHTRTGNLSIIEVNTLPGLTPSTVLYHQALTEKPALYPRELLETLIKNKGY